VGSRKTLLGLGKDVQRAVEEDPTDFTDRSQRAGGSVQTRLGLSANRDALAMALAACGLRRVIDVTVA